VIGSRKELKEPYINIPKEFLKKADNAFVVVDSWGSEIVYLNSKAYTDQISQGDLKKVMADDQVMNPTGFDIYSKGADRKADPDKRKLVDDITNWSQIQKDTK
jgi:hypothetical protein